MALPRDLAAARGLRDDASIVPYIGLWYRRVCCFPVSRSICLPCQREVARPQAVTEGLPYGQMPFQRSDIMEGLLCLELPLPGTTASRRTIPRSPLSPPLTRGPNQPVNVPAAAGSGGMRASRPTVARVVAAAPVGRAFAMVRRGGPNQPANVPPPNALFCGGLRPPLHLI